MRNRRWSRFSMIVATISQGSSVIEGIAVDSKKATPVGMYKAVNKARGHCQHSL